MSDHTMKRYPGYEQAMEDEKKEAERYIGIYGVPYHPDDAPDHARYMSAKYGGPSSHVDFLKRLDDEAIPKKVHKE